MKLTRWLVIGPVAGAVLIAGIGEVWRAAFAAPTAKPSAGGTCPVGYILAIQKPQTAAIRTIGGSVDQENGRGADAIENVCTKLGAVNGDKTPGPAPKPVARKAPKPQAANDLPKFDADGRPCTGYIQYSEANNNIVINNTGRSVAPFSPPPGFCIVTQVVSGNFTDRAGVANDTDNRIHTLTAQDNHDLEAPTPKP